MADVHIPEFWCKLCLSQCLERFDQFNCNELLNVFTAILSRSTSEAINEAFDKTLITVVAGKAYMIAVEKESGYKQLKIRFQWPVYGIEDSKRMSNKLNNASRVYDKLEKIRNNLKSCLNVDIRRLTLKQLYLAKKNHGVFFKTIIRKNILETLESQTILSTMVKILRN